MPKKIIQTVVLLLLLVVFPLLSWLFLKDGLQYRLDAKERLSIKSQLPKSERGCLQGKIQVIFQDKPGKWINRLQPIAQLFTDRHEILTFRALDSLETGQVVDSLQKAWIQSNLDGLYDNAVFLLDTTCAIKMAYKADSDDDMAALAEDIAFLLPIQKEKDFFIKREREK
ncbi:MAG: hypothetical protein IPL46_05990 [Saprospiraceae bacterium]|nr:hypothetical protein [Saprospiraceae bacterium]